jgi:6-phosphofructokinase 2
MLQELLDQERLQYRIIPIVGWTRENLTVYEETTQQQFRFGMPGPELKDIEWQQCLDELPTCVPEPTYVIASGSLPPGVPIDFYARVVAVLKECDVRLIVDTSGPALKAAVEAGVFLIKPNLGEFAALAENDLQTEEAQEDFGRELIADGRVEIIVVSLGAAGALLISKDGVERMRAPTVPIKSKVGAGDSMVAGIVTGLVSGKKLADAVRFGVAAGAAAVMTAGTELCRRDDAVELYEKMRVEASR